MATPEVVPPLLTQLRENASTLDLSDGSKKAFVEYALSRSADERKEVVTLIEAFENNAVYAGSKDQLGKLKAEVAPTLTEKFSQAGEKAADVVKKAATEAKTALEEQGPVVKAVVQEQLKDATDALVNEVGTAYLDAKSGNWSGAVGHGLTIAAPIGLAAWFGVPLLRDSWSQVGKKDGFFANVRQFFKAIFTTAAVVTGGVLLVNGAKSLSDRYQWHAFRQKAGMTAPLPVPPEEAKASPSPSNRVVPPSAPPAKAKVPASSLNKAASRPLSPAPVAAPRVPVVPAAVPAESVSALDIGSVEGEVIGKNISVEGTPILFSKDCRLSVGAKRFRIDYFLWTVGGTLVTVTSIKKVGTALELTGKVPAFEPGTLTVSLSEFLRVVRELKTADKKKSLEVEYKNSKGKIGRKKLTFIPLGTVV